ncbi:MAG TPA: SDR family oxidoreductase [Hyphomicrobiaceae bacterium]|nr:SDR family oxidoreductase [Hyphomicrobiaceae bacterium]
MDDNKTNWLRLQGRTCAVTGAAGGLGQAIAREFAACGANVALLDVTAGACSELMSEINAAGGHAAAFDCDVTSDDGVKTAAAAAEAEFGRCDVLVNNAGILRPGRLEDISIADWQKLLDINLTGYLRCAQAFGHGMRKRSQGAIVNIASIAASEPQAYSGAYSPGKAAVVMLTRQLAFEWGPDGIRSNAVSPGLVRTPLSEAFYQTPGVSERRAAIIPLRRIARTEDIADASVFLASDRASYINGQEILVDGGLSQTLMNFVPRPGYE